MATTAQVAKSNRTPKFSTRTVRRCELTGRVRGYYRTWYRDLVTAVPEVRDGYVTVPPGPGLGMELVPDLVDRFPSVVRVSRPE